MPLVDMTQFKPLPKKDLKRNLPKTIVLLVAIGAIGWFIKTQVTQPQQLANKVDPLNAGQADSPQRSTGELKTFTGEEFKTLATSMRYPNSQLFSEPPAITGNQQADARIRSIAEKRGFRLTSIPVTAIQKLNEPRLDLLGDDLLQPLAAEAWQSLKTQAKKDSIAIALLSAYRSPEYQRSLFLSRLKASPSDIAAGKADQAVETILLMTAPPGYSRHHTGFTIDLWCEDGSGQFVNSSCFRWIKANNYKVAKEHGWIPSYPDGVKLQGPEPEPWEYVWVSKDLVHY